MSKGQIASAELRAQRDEACVQRDNLMAERDAARAEREEWGKQLDAARAELDAARASAAEAWAERDFYANNDLDVPPRRIKDLERERDEARVERDALRESARLGNVICDEVKARLAEVEKQRDEWKETARVDNVNCNGAKARLDAAIRERDEARAKLTQGPKSPVWSVNGSARELLLGNAIIATVYERSFHWHTWDANGTGGENDRADSLEAAMEAAEAAVERQNANPTRGWAPHGSDAVARLSAERDEARAERDALEHRIQSLRDTILPAGVPCASGDDTLDVVTRWFRGRNVRPYPNPNPKLGTIEERFRRTELAVSELYARINLLEAQWK